MQKKKIVNVLGKSNSGFDYNYVDQKIANSESRIQKDISHLPTKAEFYNKMDEVMGKLKTILLNQEILTPKTYDIEERLEKIEKLHPKGKHVIRN